MGANVTITEEVFIWIRKNGLPDDNKKLYDAFPHVNPASLRQFKHKFIVKNGILPKQRNQSNNREKTIPDEPDLQPITHITKDIVEKWIIRKDERADLGMKFIQNEAKFSDTPEEEEDVIEEFKDLLRDYDVD